MNYLCKHDDIKVQHPAPGTDRRIMAYCDALMVCELTFKKGTTSALHKHPHDQITYVVRGSLKFSVGGEINIVQAGDTVYMPSGVEHGVLEALDESVIVDTFAPKRADFLK